MFKAIVDRLDGWERMVDGLDAIAQTGRLEESELERKFINVLRKHARLQPDWTWNEENVDGQVHYTLKLSEHLAYHIQPQAELGHNQGFSSPTRPDFLITATRYLVNGEEKRHVLPQWAIFLDGFQYHASAQHRRFEGDVVKREQLRLHPGYAVWTLTWDDVVRFEQGLGGEEGGNAVDFVADTLASHPCVQHALTLARGLHREQPRLHSWRNNVDRLFALLENPAILPRESKSEWAVYFATFQELLFHKHHQEVEHALAQYMALPVDPPREKTLDFWLPLQLPKRVSPIAEVRAVVNLHSEGDVQIAWEAGSFDEPAKEDWEAFWTWYNMFQFFPWRSAPVAQVSPERLYVLPQAQSVRSLAAEPEGLEIWLEQMQLSFPDFSDQIQELWSAGYFQKPEDEDALTEICNERGESLFTADFVHPRTREVYGVTDPEAVAWLKARGYKIVD
jgi:DEAD/DEAH box helicase domain-containing protein